MGSTVARLGGDYDHTVRKCAITRVLKRFVELDTGERFGHDGQTYPRGNGWSRGPYIEPYAERHEEARIRQNLRSKLTKLSMRVATLNIAIVKDLVLQISGALDSVDPEQPR